MLILETPSKLRLVGYEEKLKVLSHHLEYHDKKIDYEIKRLKNNPWYITQHGQDAFNDELARLKGLKIKSLLFQDKEGYWTYSGLSEMLSRVFNDKVTSKVTYPEPKLIPWKSKPTKKLRYYQKEALDALLKVRHGAISMGTGLGKSLIQIHLLKELALPSLLMAPSTSIADQTYEEMVAHFGTKYVGKFYGGKKQLGKLFTIGLHQSLSKIEEGDEAHEFFSKVKVFIADESHLCPADTLEAVCMGIVKDAPYRFFFSGTQVRGDGLEIVLNGIIGPIVYEMSVREGVDKGFLTRPDFRVISVSSASNYYNSDSIAMVRKHFFYNPEVNKWAAEVANKSVFEYNRPTLILVEEVKQLTYLLPYLRCPVKFAHAPLDKDGKKNLPVEFHDSDPGQLVEDFNNKKFPLLVGTSCIATGTDIQAVGSLIYLMETASEIKVKQAVGRSTRLFEGKENCLFFDFDVENIDVCHRHLLKRVEYYNEIYGPVKSVRF